MNDVDLRLRRRLAQEYGSDLATIRLLLRFGSTAHPGFKAPSLRTSKALSRRRDEGLLIFFAERERIGTRSAYDRRRSRGTA